MIIKGKVRPDLRGSFLRISNRNGCDGGGGSERNWGLKLSICMSDAICISDAPLSPKAN